MRFVQVQTFEEWRTQARLLLQSSVPPSEVRWTETADPREMLFDLDVVEDPGSPSERPAFSVPKAFLSLAEIVASHRSAIRWELLYRTLWRLTHGEKHLLGVSTDDDIHDLEQFKAAVRRDAHKMKAFVRFRRVLATPVDPMQANIGSDEQFVAWHRPDHRVVRLVAPFFSRRFKAMTWTILTPDESVHWDQEQLHFGPGAPSTEAPDPDELESLWKTYYASTFNPARIKLATMKREMPVRHWPTLPETELIPELLATAAQRVETMVRTSEGFDQNANVPVSSDLHVVANAAKVCQACDLHCEATQTVFGEGPHDARIMVIGEQPGDQEDLQGRPFVGPAGQLLDELLESASVSREQIYITNTVKHFKFVRRGKRRLHQRPDAREIAACQPWLEAELAVVKPEVLLCLGATSAQAIFGRQFRITESRGQPFASRWCAQTIASWHPAAILRMTDSSRQSEMKSQLATDLQTATQTLSRDRGI